jgi:1-deoxy-D-xylulose 5-phosphate reductoisomerase
MVQTPTHAPATHIFILHEGNIHSFRQIFMNAGHPEDPDPTWYGHSIGSWDGDTLVVDTVGFNDKFWFDYLGHPQSVIHSMVSYVDGSVLAQLGSPDMRTPIAYALGWPHRITAPSPRLDLAQLGKLTFEAPDPKRFPALRLVRRALQSGGAAPTIMNAANEIAVASFLDRRIGFLEIAAVVEEILDAVEAPPLTSLDDVLEADAMARRHAREACARRAR